MEKLLFNLHACNQFGWFYIDSSKCIANNCILFIDIFDSNKILSNEKKIYLRQRRLAEQRMNCYSCYLAFQNEPKLNTPLINDLTKTGNENTNGIQPASFNYEVHKICLHSAPARMKES